MTWQQSAPPQPPTTEEPEFVMWRPGMPLWQDSPPQRRRKTGVGRVVLLIVTVLTMVGVAGLVAVAVQAGMKNNEESSAAAGSPRQASVAITPAAAQTWLATSDGQHFTAAMEAMKGWPRNAVGTPAQCAAVDAELAQIGTDGLSASAAQHLTTAVGKFHESMRLCAAGQRWEAQVARVGGSLALIPFAMAVGYGTS